MDNSQQNITDQLRHWHYWWLVTFSLLLIITFVYYLPVRFLYKSASGDGNMHHDAMMGANMMADHAHDNAMLMNLPLRTPANRIERLPFIERDGVKEFHLEANEFRWEYEPGKWMHAWGYNGQIPGPEIRVTEGDTIRIIVQNNLPDATTIHWHGVDVPWQMDGVAGVTQKSIPPGASFTYEFSAVPAGTRFYHSHGKDHATAAQQLDMGLSGAFIIEPKNPTLTFNKEFTLLLDEWDIMGGINSAISHVHGTGMMGAVPEFNTFTINGRVFPYTDMLPVQKDDRVLVRFINVGSSAFHPMHLHGHSFDVVAKDGFSIARSAIETRNTITINPGETVDILIKANNPGPWLLHCHHVHHAAAGMITLFQYDGYEPITPLMSTAEQVMDMSEENMMNAGNHTVADDHHNGKEIKNSGSAWGLLLIISLILIVVLSTYVKKYIGGK